MAVSGQLDDSGTEFRERLYREDLAVSGQLDQLSGPSKPKIIPRGFGGIRTTARRFVDDWEGIIPRGFGGIRTTINYSE